MCCGWDKTIRIKDISATYNQHITMEIQRNRWKFINRSLTIMRYPEVASSVLLCNYCQLSQHALRGQTYHLLKVFWSSLGYDLITI